MKTYKPSPAAVQMLVNIAHGRDIAYGLPPGRSHQGGAGSTKISLWRRGLHRDGALTDAGIDVLRSEQFAVGKLGGNVMGGPFRREWEKYRDAIHAAQARADQLNKANRP